MQRSGHYCSICGKKMTEDNSGSIISIHILTGLGMVGKGFFRMLTPVCEKCAEQNSLGHEPDFRKPWLVENYAPYDVIGSTLKFYGEWK